MDEASKEQEHPADALEAMAAGRYAQPAGRDNSEGGFGISSGLMLLSEDDRADPSAETVTEAALADDEEIDSEAATDVVGADKLEGTDVPEAVLVADGVGPDGEAGDDADVPEAVLVADAAGVNDGVDPNAATDVPEARLVDEGTAGGEAGAGVLGQIAAAAGPGAQAQRWARARTQDSHSGRVYAHQFKRFIIPPLVAVGGMLLAAGVATLLMLIAGSGAGSLRKYGKFFVLAALPLGAFLLLGAWLFWIETRPKTGRGRGKASDD